MTISSDLRTALALTGARTTWVLEIEGIPYAYGTVAATSSWWSGATFEGLVAAIARSETGGPIIDFGDTKLNVTEGRCEIGECSVTLHDHDDTLHAYCASARADGRAHLQVDLPSTGTTTTLGNGATIGTSGTLWLGREACTYTRSGSSLTLTRAKYRSTARGYKGRERGGLGQVVTEYPGGLVGRRCWLKLGLGASEATSDAAMTQVFAGVIDGFSWEGRRLKLELHDAQALARRPILHLPSRYLGKTPFVLPGVGVAAVGEDAADGTRTLALLPGKNLAILERDSTLDENNHAWRIVGGLGSAIGGIAAGSAASAANLDAPRGVVVVAPEVEPFFATGFTGTEREGWHPLDLALRILMGGSGDATYGAFPYGGCEIDSSLVDVAGFELLRDRTIGFRVSPWLVFDGVKDGRQWIAENLLRPWGFFLRTTLEGQIGVGQLGALQTLFDKDSATQLGDDDLARDVDGSRVEFSGPNIEGARVIRGVHYVTEWTKDGKPAEEFTATVDSLSDGEDQHDADGDVLELATQGLRGKTAAVANGVRILSLVADRYAIAPQIFTAAFPLPYVVRSDGSTVEVGDLVVCTFADVANPYGASRGLSGAVLEVWSRRVDWLRWTVTFELAATFALQRNSRFLAPNCTAITSSPWNNTTKTLTVLANDFTDPSGPYKDVDAFEVGDVIRFYRGDLSARSAATTIAAINRTASTITVDKNAAALGFTPAGGADPDIVRLGDYDEVSTARRRKYAFAADATRTLGAAGDPAHEHD